MDGQTISFGTLEQVKLHLASTAEPTALICHADRNAIDGFLASIRYEHPPGD